MRSPLARLTVESIEVMPDGHYLVIAGHRWKMTSNGDTIRLRCESTAVDLTSSGAVRFAGQDLRSSPALTALMRGLTGQSK